MEGEEMKRVLTFLMFGLAVAGIACNVQFYSSVSDGIGSFFYGTIGLLFDVSKLTLIVLAVYFYYRNSINHALASMAGWVVLSGISLVAAYGFFGVLNAEYEQKQLAQSNVYAMSKQSVETANAKVESLSQYADADYVRLAEIEKKKLETQRNKILHGPIQNSLGTTVGSLDKMTSGCTANNWYSRKYCGQLTEIDNKISELDERINGYGLYISAVKHRDSAMANLTGLNPASVEQAHHPVFIMLATVMATTAHDVKAWFLLLTSFVLEALASLLFYLRASLSHSEGTVSVQNGTISAKFYQEKKTDTLKTQSPPSDALSAKPGTISVKNDVLSVFERVKGEILKGNLDTPSYKKLRGFGLKDSQIKQVREMLVDSKVCVKDVTGKLVAVR
jgi:hypothetical protein